MGDTSAFDEVEKWEVQLLEARRHLRQHHRRRPRDQEAIEHTTSAITTIKAKLREARKAAKKAAKRELDEARQAHVRAQTAFERGSGSHEALQSAIERHQAAQRMFRKYG